MARRKNRQRSSSSSSPGSSPLKVNDHDRVPPAATFPPSNSSPPVSLEMESNTMQGISRIVEKITVPGDQDSSSPKKDPSPEPQQPSATDISPPVYRSMLPAPASAAPKLNPVIDPAGAAMHGIPSRALLLSGIPQHIADAQVMQELEYWGPIRAFFLGSRSQGCVTAHYCDLRHAQNALVSIRSQFCLQQCNPVPFSKTSPSVPPENRPSSFQPAQPQQSGPKPYEPVKYELANVGFVTEDRHHQQQKKISPSFSKFSPLALPFNPYYRDGPGSGLIGGAAVWADFLSSAYPETTDRLNTGTLVVFYLRMELSLDNVQQFFQEYGDVREVREGPSRRNKFVEYYDIRDAARAKQALDGVVVLGRRIKIEFSRPCMPKHLGSYPPLYPSLFPYYYYSYCCNASSATTSYRQYEGTDSTAYCDFVPFDYDLAATLPYNVGGGAFQTYYSPSYGTGYYNYPALYHYQQQQYCYGYYSQLQRPQQQPYYEAPGYTSSPPLLPSPRYVPRTETTGTLITRPRFENFNQHARYQSRDKEVAVNGKGNAKTCIVSYTMERMEWSRKPSRRSGNARKSRQDGEFNYVFNTEENEEGGRTTLMIRNIPVKYSLSMIIRVLDNHCVTYNNSRKADEKVSAYDFVYLPVDFMYKCNLGYAFVNFTSVVATKRLYEDFHDRRWEQINSRKVCQVAYARLQGRAELEAHFKNSKFACDTDEYLPLVFNPPRTGSELFKPTVIMSLAARKGVMAQQMRSHVPGSPEIESIADSNSGTDPDPAGEKTIEEQEMVYLPEVESEGDGDEELIEREDEDEEDDDEKFAEMEDGGGDDE